MSSSQPDVRIDQLAPHSIEAEEGVLGSIITNGDAIYAAASLLKPDDFFIVRYSWIYQAMLGIHERREAIDYLTVKAELEQTNRFAEVGGEATLLKLMAGTYSIYYTEDYALIVKRMALRRRLIDAASKIARVAHSDETDIDAVITKSQEALRVAVVDHTEHRIVKAAAVADTAQAIRDEEYEARQSGGNLALSTGIDDLDWCTFYQIRLGRYVSILGASGHFKTSIAAQMCAFWAAIKEIPVLYVSQEMPPHEVYESMVRALACTQNWTVNQADKHLRAAPLSFISKRQSIANISAAVQTVSMEYGGAQGVVVVDTLNKTLDVTETRGDITAGMTRASAALDGLKLDSGWLVLSLIQQYIETNTTDPLKLRPSRNNIKNAKAPYEDSDVMFGTYYADHWRHEYGNAFDDPYCPKGHLLIKALKTRKGDVERAKLIKVLPNVPAFLHSEIYDKEQAAKSA